MNNTKWREVLDLVGRYDVEIQFAFVRDERFLSLTRFPENGVEGNHTLDCTFHGPFMLREIFAIKCPKYVNGRKYQGFVDSIKDLGQLSLSEDNDGLIINGYQK